MATYIVTYDLNKEAKRPPLLEKIKDEFAWARLSESSYAIATAMSVEQVYSVLKPMLDDNDNLYVIPLSRPYAGFGPPAVNDWLEQHLP